MRREYTPRGSTRNHPCHGCGVVKLKPTHGLCQECRAALDWARGERERINELHGVVVRQLPWARHALPYTTLAPIGRTAGLSEAQDRIREVIWSVLHALDLAYGGAGRILRERRAEGWQEPPIPAGSESSWGTDARFIAVPRDVANSLDDLLPAIQHACALSAQAAYAAGRDLLGALADGSLTADQLAAKDADRARSVQVAQDKPPRAF